MPISKQTTGWVIEVCGSDPAVSAPMAVFLEGVPQINAAVVRVSYKSQLWPGTPQIAVLYASGFIRSDLYYTPEVTAAVKALWGRRKPPFDFAERSRT